MQVSWVGQSAEGPQDWGPYRGRLAGVGPTSGLDTRRRSVMALLVTASLVSALAPSLFWSARSDAPALAVPAAQAWPSGLQEAVSAASAADAYAVQAVADAASAGPAWLAPNPAQGLDARFSGDGVTLAPRAGTEGSWRWGLSLAAAWGRAGDLVPVDPAQPEAEANRVEYRRGDLTEWYVNDARGLEQGFSLAKAPAGQGSAPLQVQLGLSGGLEAQLIDDGKAVTVRSSEGANLLRYDKLVAYDATGAEIPAHLGLDGSALTLTVDDAGAAYPLLIDPLIASLQAELTAADAAGGEQFGSSVSISGNTAVVGAP